MPTSIRVLVIDDELLQRKIIGHQLSELKFVADTARNATEGLQILQTRDFDVVLLDVQMPDVSGLEALALIKKLEDAPEVIMLTLDVSLESGVAAIRAGAYDYLIKPASPDALEITVKKAAEKRRLARRNSTLQDFIKARTSPIKTVAEPVQASAMMRQISEQAETVAPLNSTILITGESGTGKDVLARYIHNRSGRSGSAMVSVNCGAMPENLFESEFFGYEKGAFSGATATKRGLIEVADGSTLFLDEIGEMPINLQVKLLRFLESGEFRRVGGTRNLFSDARLIAATNQDLHTAIREKRFRSDLYYRLNVIELHIPPLRLRRGDVCALIDFYLDFYGRQFRKPTLNFSVEAKVKLENYDFPGNVRELKNIIERAVALSADDRIEADQIYFQKTLTAPDESASSGNTGTLQDLSSVFELSAENSIVRLDDLERRYILSVLTHTKGNRERAAVLLGISERTLYRRLRDYE
jgi:two-component system response regulator AtoC